MAIWKTSRYRNSDRRNLITKKIRMDKQGRPIQRFEDTISRTSSTMDFLLSCPRVGFFERPEARFYIPNFLGLNEQYIPESFQDLIRCCLAWAQEVARTTLDVSTESCKRYVTFLHMQGQMRHPSPAATQPRFQFLQCSIVLD